MDPLTTLLAAAAATGPNTLQRQALTAGFEVRGPSRKLLHAHGESPSATGAGTGAANRPAIQPDHCPASTGQQHFFVPIMPLASPLADPAPTALHIPTLQAIHRTQQQTSPAPAMMPMMPQTPITQPQATLPRDPTEYTQANFPSLTGRFGTAGDAGPASTAQQRTQYPAARPEHGIGPHTAHQHHLTPLGGRTARDRSRSRTRPQHRRHRRSRSHRQER